MAKKKKPTPRQYIRSVAQSFDTGSSNGHSRRASDSHKGVRWGLYASIAVVLSVIGPYVSSFLGGYEKADHARQEISKVYRAISSLSRSMAWMSVASIKTEKTVAENRATDCDIKIANGEHLSIMEMQACAKWKSDAKDADTRYANAYAAADASAKAAAKVGATQTEDVPAKDQ